MKGKEPSFFTSLMSGAAAGVAVDLILFPVDTVKTRLQSAHGFWATGGFRGIYRGIASTAVGSAPNAALFFVTYDTINSVVAPLCPEQFHPLLHMAAACSGEVVACIVRVPVEVVKQRTQTVTQSSSFSMFQRTMATEGISGLYRGFFSTVMREIPFALIQYPLWEILKKYWSARQGHYVDSWQASLCGAVAGGVSAALTTPFDVVKTRVMLAEKGSQIAQGHIWTVMNIIRQEKGIAGLYAGMLPRVFWISVGGAVFFGVYEKTKNVLQSNF